MMTKFLYSFFIHVILFALVAAIIVGLYYDSSNALSQSQSRILRYLLIVYFTLDSLFTFLFLPLYCIGVGVILKQLKSTFASESDQKDALETIKTSTGFRSYITSFFGTLLTLALLFTLVIDNYIALALLATLSEVISKICIGYTRHICRIARREYQSFAGSEKVSVKVVRKPVGGWNFLGN